MATLVGTQKDIAKLLEQLTLLEYDALEAYQVAIERLESVAHREAFERFWSDHSRHVSELSQVISEYGGEPPAGPDTKALLTKGKVVLAGILGDKAILMAMKTNEDDTNTAYERAAARDDVPSMLRTLFEANLSDERAHRAYIVQALGEEPDQPASTAPQGPSVRP